jgi:hypothetical protein
MGMKGQTACAVPERGARISGDGNLCGEHRLPGPVVHVGDSAMVIVAWYVEHGEEVGIVLLNDYDVGADFGRRKGFETRLGEQGFTGACNIETPEELAAAKTPAEGKKVGDWSGPWRTQYPWQS